MCISWLIYLTSIFLLDDKTFELRNQVRFLLFSLVWISFVSFLGGVGCFDFDFRVLSWDREGFFFFFTKCIKSGPNANT